MFFTQKDERRKKTGFSLLVLLRVLLSLVMLLVLTLAVIQALRYFAGTSSGLIPSDPKSIILSLITSEEMSRLTQDALNFTPPSNLSDLRLMIRNPTDFFNKSTSSASLGNNLPGLSHTEVLRFALVADSHNDNFDLNKALVQAKDMGAKFVIGLGDYTQVGSLDELKKANETFALSGLTFYSTSGDHDLWDARNQGNNPVDFYNQVFGQGYSSFADSGVDFIIINNSDDYQGVDATQINWLNKELIQASEDNYKAIFVFMHEPLYHPTSDHFMGIVTPKLSQQVQDISIMLVNAHVAQIFAGDTHFFTRYTDPKTGLKMMTVGAITKERNLQTPRFAIVDVFQDGSYNISDTEIR